jgi:hypothetical protein
MKPRNSDIRVDNHVNEIKPTEYFIGFSNEVAAIGMIKHAEDIEDQVSLAPDCDL